MKPEIFEGTIFVDDMMGTVVLISDSVKKPEPYAGFIGEGLHLLITKNADLSDEAIEVLGGYSSSRTIDSICIIKEVT